MFKKLNIIMIVLLVFFGVNLCSYATDSFDDFYDEEIEQFVDDNSDDVFDEESEDTADQISSQALNDYDANGSLFEKITMLEQEKVVAQLEKERAQLDLELDRLNAERIKLQMELDTLSGRAEQQQHELENAKKQLEIQTEKLMRQKDVVENEETTVVAQKPQPKREEADIVKKYKLINVVGIDNQLQATIEELSTGQNKRISVGKEIDGFVVKSISLNDGIVFEKDGETESLNIGK